MEWQPIETTPKDGTVVVAVRRGVPNPAVYSIILFDKPFGWVGFTAEEEKRLCKYQPTHWMPLPPPPETK